MIQTHRSVIGAVIGGGIVVMALLVGGLAGHMIASHHSAKPLPGDGEPTRLIAPTRLAVRDGTVALTSATGSCGVELWSIKTLTDPAAGQVNLTPKPTSISTLAAATPPTFSDTRPRSAPVETQAWTLTATLTGFKMEADSDYHLILSDGAGHTMIAEIPDPACVAASSPVRAGIAAARAAFEATGHTAATQCFGCVSQTVTVTGVGFFDALHGQSGVAPNGVELHPVFAFAMGGSPPPPPPPTTTTVPTTTTTPTPPGDDALDERPGCNLYPGRIYWNHVRQSHCSARFFLTP